MNSQPQSYGSLICVHVRLYRAACTCSSKALSTRILCDLKRQFFYGYGFRPHVSDENDQWKRSFSKTLRSHYQFKSTPRNFRNLFKMADGRFHLVVFYTWVYFYLTVSTTWRTSQRYKPRPKKFKNGAKLLFRGLIIANTYASSMRSRVSRTFAFIIGLFQ